MEPNDDVVAGPVRIGALLPAYQEKFADLFQRARADGLLDEQGAIELELTSQKARSKVLPVVNALMENNLARKGVWSNDPDRKTLELRYQTEDLVGALTVEYSLGQLSTFEMELVAWIFGRWGPQRQTVTFSLRECARDFGTSWSGQRAEFLKQALRRIDRTRFTGVVWDARTKKKTTKHFGIFDVVEITEQATSFDAPATRPGTVKVTLSSFMVDQLVEHQYVRLDWNVMRFALQSPLARRLYVFLQSQRGFKQGDGNLYEITIDNQLMESIGSKDKANPRRFRAKLLKAGEEIVKADSQYEAIVIRATKRGKGYVLHVRRRAA